MTVHNQMKIDYLLFLADTTLILAQRNGEWCGHGPVLEQDIAITNITLDLVGQARNFYQYAAQLLNEKYGSNETEDSLAYLRNERAFKNLLIAELPNGDWAQSVLRQFFFSVYQSQLFTQLQNSSDEQLAAIATKSLKETKYHVKWSSEWVIRLGDGTAESHARMNHALDTLWPYTGEFFVPATFELPVVSGYDPAGFREPWLQKVEEIFVEATLSMPAPCFMHTGGKTGVHTEHMGFILAEMQSLQRSYPGAEW